MDFGCVRALAASELSGVLAIGIAGAGQELSVAAPFDDHLRAALVADFVRLLLQAFDVLHLRLGLHEVLLEFLPELVEGVQEAVSSRLDLIQLLLHRRCVLDVHDVGEVDYEEVDDHEAELGGPQPTLALFDVLAGLDGRDDARVRGGATDAVLLQLLHQARLAEAGWRLCEVLVGVEFLEREGLALLEGRELVAGLGLGVVRLQMRLLDRLLRLDLLLAGLLVNREEALEPEDGALGTQQIGGPAGGWCRGDVYHRLVVEGRAHLRGHETVPDELVQRELVLGEEALDGLRRPRHVGGSDRLVRVLGALLRAVEVGLLGDVLRPVHAGDALAHGAKRIRGDPGGVGAHVGDQAGAVFAAELHPFVELLGDLHRPPHREAQLAVGVLLQLGRDEGRHGPSLALPRLDFLDTESRLLEILPDGVGSFVVSDLDPLAIPLHQVGAENGGPPRLEVHLDRPVLLGLEGLDLPLAVADELERDRLHSAGAQAPAHFLPENRADLVADQPVEHAARLLRVHFLRVHINRVLEGGQDRPLRDLVEDHAAELGLRLLALAAQLLREVPADGLALPVGVSGQVDRVGRLRGLLELVEHLLARGQRLVLDREAALDVDPQLLLGQVAHVSHRGLHGEAAPEVLVDGLRLCGRLDDDQVLRHGPSFSRTAAQADGAPAR